MKIKHCAAEEILDSRGTPTVKVILEDEKGNSVWAAVPSGKSAGTKEALELRDPDGKGVKMAIHNIEEIITPALCKRDFSSPNEVDELLLELDGTENKTALGANATLAISIAATKLFAKEKNLPVWKYIAELTHTNPAFPRLYMNVLNGGAHADFCLPFQEYIVVVGKESPTASYATANNLFDELGRILEKEGKQIVYGDEGGYAVGFSELQKPFEMLNDLIQNEEGVGIAIDAAASEFFKDGIYTMHEKKYSREEMVKEYEHIVDMYRMISIEDPFHEDDIEGFQKLMEARGGQIKVVGDDLTVTNPKVLARMIDSRAANALIVKPNQIGTLKEVYETVRLAKTAGWEIIASHRSGETEDPFIADLAVGLGAYGIKAGARTQKERRVKYERLIEIEKEFNNA